LSILKNNTTDQQTLNTLEKDYLKLLKDLKLTPQLLTSVIELAHLKAYYLNKGHQAIELLVKSQSIKGLNTQDKNILKLELADIQLFLGHHWQAILLYAQINKSTPNSSLGHEAKLKKAKAAYFTGELKWAQAQLDALKGSTSKLIANDALALSRLIKENPGPDSTNWAIKQYAQAEYLALRRLDSLAIETLETILQKVPHHSIKNHCLLKEYHIYLRNNHNTKALKALNRIINKNPHNLLEDRALFLRANLLESMQQKEKAMESYKLILSLYPQSIFVIESRERYRILRGN